MDLSSIPLHEGAFLFAAAFIAGLVRGFSGFGAAMIFIPVASIVLTPAVAIPVMWVIDVVPSIMLLRKALRQWSPKTVLPTIFGYGIFVFPAAYLLATGDPIVLRWILCVIIMVLVACLASGIRYQSKPKTGVSLFVGSIAGGLGGSVGVAGPPILIYWLSGQDNKTRIRANTIMFFALSTVFSGLAYWQSGILVPTAFYLAALVIPLYAFAIFLGARIFGQSSEQNFRAVAYAVILLSAIIGMPIFDAFFN